MSEFAQKVGTELYQRVWVAKKSTILGLGFVVAGVIVDALAASPNKIAAIIGSLIGTGLVLYKGKVAAE